jgi:hypothetical protein
MHPSDLLAPRSLRFEKGEVKVSSVVGHEELSDVDVRVSCYKARR